MGRWQRNDEGAKSGEPYPGCDRSVFEEIVMGFRWRPMDVRRSSAARPASESPRGRKPRAAAMRYGDLSGRAAAATSSFRLIFASAGPMLAVAA
jgi:hypothetical protein